MEKSIDDLYREYLEKIFVRLEMVKNIQTHELSLINRKEKIYIRYLIGNSLKTLDYKLQRFNIYNRPRNFYISCAFHSRLPIISDDLRTRKETPEYQSFDKNYIDTVLSWDILFDLDGKHGEDYYGDTLKIKDILDESKVPYVINSSSFSGFHVIIPHTFVPFDSIKELIDNIQNKIMPNIKLVHNLKSLDIDLMDLKKLRKLEYSPVVDGSIVLPISDEMLKNWDKESISIESVLKNIIIKNRGLLLRTHGLDEQTLKLNVDKFLKSYLE